MIDALITDLVRTSGENIRRAGVKSLDEVRRAPALIRFSAEMAAEQQELKRFLRYNLYQHFLVARMAYKAQRVVTELFAAFRSDPKMLPPRHRAAAERDSLERAIADYIAGMTDRYAIREHRRLFAVETG
jgi:dGTPase